MTEVRLKAPVRAVPVANAFKSEGIPGAFDLKKQRSAKGFWGHIRFRCPCGCGSFSRLPIGLKEKPAHGVAPGGIEATWEWDGQRKTPTLSPSIHHIGHWHGWLRKGYFEQA